MRSGGGPFLLPDIHRRADFEDTMGKRPGDVDVARIVMSVAKGVRPIHNSARLLIGSGLEKREHQQVYHRPDVSPRGGAFKIGTGTRRVVEVP